MGTSVLEFDKPIAELERQIEELRQQAEAQKIDVSAEIAPLQQKLGRRDVLDLVGGYKAWGAAKLPTEAQPTQA